MNKNWFLYAVLGLLIIMVVWAIFFMQGEGRKCMANPYVYGASKMKNIFCSCQQFREDKICPATFFFNETAYYTMPTYCGGQNPIEYDINYTFVDSK